MTIAFPCERCGHRFEVDSSLAGKKCKCKKCEHVFVIPVPRQPSRPASKALKSFGAEATAKPPKATARHRPARVRPRPTGPRRA